MIVLTLRSAVQTTLVYIQTNVFLERRTKRIIVITILSAIQDAALNRSVHISLIAIKVAWKIQIATIIQPQTAVVRAIAHKMWFVMETKSMVITVMETLSVSPVIVMRRNTCVSPMIKGSSHGIHFSNLPQSASSPS